MLSPFDHKKNLPSSSLAAAQSVKASSGRLSYELKKLKIICHQDKISLSFLMGNLSSHSHSLLALLFSIPFLFPLPLPGLSVIFGLIISCAGLGILLRKKPWLPQSLLKRQISGHLLRKIFDGGLRLCVYLEKIVRPRGKTIAGYTWIQQVNGLIIFLSGLLLALPLPPGTNFPPSLTIMFLCMGSLEDDFLFMLLGYGAFILNIAIFTALFIYGAKGIYFIFQN